MTPRWNQTARLDKYLCGTCLVSRFFYTRLYIRPVDLLPVIKQIQIAHFYSAKVWNRKTIDLIQINISWKSTIDYWRWQKVYCKKEWRNKEEAIKLNSQSILVLKYEIRIKNQLQIGCMPIAKPYGSSCNMSFGAGM